MSKKSTSTRLTPTELCLFQRGYQVFIGQIDYDEELGSIIVTEVDGDVTNSVTYTFEYLGITYQIQFKKGVPSEFFQALDEDGVLNLYPNKMISLENTSELLKNVLRKTNSYPYCSTCVYYNTYKLQGKCNKTYEQKMLEE